MDWKALRREQHSAGWWRYVKQTNQPPGNKARQKRERQNVKAGRNARK